MRNVFLLLLFNLSATLFLRAQVTIPNDKQRKEISSLIDHYSKARENGDTVLLKRILTEDVDQLVSTGEWRSGIDAAVQGMLRSSANSPGTRTLNVEKIRMLKVNCAVVDCRYEIQNPDGTIRKMWSTFIVVADKRTWKIAAIRNMLPTER
jgi:uncharacterized protein (TIGR02246 family)